MARWVCHGLQTIEVVKANAKTMTSLLIIPTVLCLGLLFVFMQESFSDQEVQH
jgi:hypothetical protein